MWALNTAGVDRVGALEHEQLFPDVVGMLAGQPRECGQPLAIPNLADIIHKYQKKMIPQPHIWAHGLRHACATHLLEGGADIRYIQELLGHSSLGSTQIYTKVDITQLKKVHHQCHPRERV